MKWFRENWYFVVIAVVVFGVLFTSQDSFSDKAANKVDAQSEAYLADFNEKKEEILRQIAEDTEKEREKLEEERTAEEQESEQNYESDAQDTCSAGELDDAETSSSASDEITTVGGRLGKPGRPFLFFLILTHLYLLLLILDESGKKIRGRILDAKNGADSFYLFQAEITLS